MTRGDSSPRNRSCAPIFRQRGVFMGLCANGGQSMPNALFNDNRLKLGICGLNVRSGCAAPTAEGHPEPTWDNNVDIAVMLLSARAQAIFLRLVCSQLSTTATI